MLRGVRRALFALVPLLALLGVTEAVGRRRPDPRAGRPELLYEPGAALVTRAGDTVRTTRPELHEQSWAMPAPGYRVAFVGDSTVWGQLPEAFAQGTTHDGSPIEVLNFGIRGAASDRALVEAQSAVDQDIDLLVVYVGHNEVTEARINPFSRRPLWKRELIAGLFRTGTARLLEPWIGGLRQAEPEAGTFRPQGDAVPRPLEEAEWTGIAAGYRENLAAICALGVPTVLVEPISSLVNPGEPPDGAATTRDALRDGYVDLREGAPAAALRWADDLGRFYPSYGPPHALRGLAWIQLGRRDEGVEELRTARRLDAQPSRATEAHFAILREVGADCGATVVPAEPSFLADPRYLDPADPLFMDRVHPTLAGNVLLASVIAGAVPGLAYDPARVTLPTPSDEATRGWKLVDELWR